MKPQKMKAYASFDEWKRDQSAKNQRLIDALDHVQFRFYAGSKLKDPEGLLVGRGKHVRHVKVVTTEGIPRKALVALLDQVL